MPDDQVNIPLDDARAEQLDDLAEQGNQAAEVGNYTQARRCFEQALDLLPEPRTQWEAATWLLTSLGDITFLQGQFHIARDYLQAAMHCPDAIGNPFIHLRLGQVQLELGNRQRAVDGLTRAYMGGGREIFDDEDPKYFRAIKPYLRNV